MKSRIAAALSLTGVLMSGSAAALVNTQVLAQEQATASSSSVTDTIPTDAYTSSALPADESDSDESVNYTESVNDEVNETTSIPESIETEEAEIGEAPTLSTAPATTPATTPTTTPAAPKPVQTVFDFAVSNAGKISLDTAGGTLTIAETSSNAGWVVSKIGRPKPTRAEIWFNGAGVEIKFSAELANGTIYTSIESGSSTPTTTPVPTTTKPAPTSTTTAPRGEERDDD